MLSDIDIKNAILNGEAVVRPLDTALLQPSSLDVRLDSTFLVPDPRAVDAIDPCEEPYYPMKKVYVRQFEPFVLHPGDFVLASTYERVTLGPEIAARLEGKSSLGRLGLLTHATAGFIDPGFDGNITLELANLTRQPIKLWPGMKIGQLCFFRLDHPADKPYGSKVLGSHYGQQSGPTASRSHEGFTIFNIYGE